MIDVSSFKLEIFPEYSDSNQNYSILKNEVAIAVNILNVILNNKGSSYPNYPEFGFDLAKYKFEDVEEINRIKSELDDTLSNFFRDYFQFETKLEFRENQENNRNELIIQVSLGIPHLDTSSNIYNLKNAKFLVDSYNILYIISKNSKNTLESKILI